MKLTKTMREAFVRAVMQDVPKVDYANKLRDAINKEIVKIKKAAGISNVDDARLADNWNNNIRNSKGSAGTSFCGRGLLREERKSIEVMPELVAMQDASEAQDAHLSQLESKLSAAISACTTRAALAAALPEFEKYLPADEPKALRSLPSMANVASEFVKAGWPKKSVKK